MDDKEHDILKEGMKKEIEFLKGKMVDAVEMLRGLEGDLNNTKSQLADATVLLDRYRLRADRELELNESIPELVKRETAVLVNLYQVVESGDDMKLRHTMAALKIRLVAEGVISG